MSSSIISFEDIANEYDPRKNMSRPIMSKFEKAKIIGVRMEQIARGSPALVNLKTTNVRDIVLAELAEKKLPFVVIRVMPNGIKEYWKVKDMTIIP